MRPRSIGLGQMEVSKPWGCRGEGAATRMGVPRMVERLLLLVVSNVKYLYATVYNKVPGSIHRRVPKHTMRSVYAQHQRSKYKKM